MSSGGNNFYKYITTEGKLIGEEARKFTMLEYLQKNTGVFNQDGMISKEEIKAMKKRAQTGAKNLWYGFISFDKEHSEMIDDPDKCIELIKQTFGEFLKDAGFDVDNIDLMCALHLDKPEHLHIHYEFWEKEPKVKNKRAAGYKYRAKGKIKMDAIDKMMERLNAYTIPDDLKERRDEAVYALYKREDFAHARFKDKAMSMMKELAKELPEDKPWWYASKNMKPYRGKIDEIVDFMIMTDTDLFNADLKFRNELERKKKALQSIMSDYYKDRLKDDESLIKDGQDCNVEIDLPRIHTIEKPEWDYKRRLGNIVLKKVKYIKENTFTYDKSKKYKTNDRFLKRGIAISNKKIKREMDGFFTSLVRLFTPELNSHRNRLREIEEEMQAEHEQELQEAAQEQQRLEANARRWDWGK